MSHHDLEQGRVIVGGTGGGIANTREELWEIGNKGLKLSMRSQIMVERSLLGWKEVEYEVMRDGAGNCITICNMENFDPMGVHTGDSIVVAPSQTLSDLEYHMLRTASLKIIQALGIEGGCNVQLAVTLLQKHTSAADTALQERVRAREDPRRAQRAAANHHATAAARAHQCGHVLGFRDVSVADHGHGAQLSHQKWLR